MSGMDDGNSLTGFEVLIQNIVKENKIKQCLIKQTQLKVAELEKELSDKKDKLKNMENQLEHNHRVNKQLSQSLSLRESNVDRLREHMRILEEQEMSVRQQMTIKNQEKQLRRLKLEKLFEEIKQSKSEFVSSFATISLNKTMMMKETNCGKDSNKYSSVEPVSDKFNTSITCDMYLEESQCDIENVLSSTRKDDQKEINTTEMSADQSFCESSTMSEETKQEPAVANIVNGTCDITIPQKHDSSEQIDVKKDEQKICKKEELNDQIKPICKHTTMPPSSQPEQINVAHLRLKNEPIEGNASFRETSSILEDIHFDQTISATVGTVQSEKDYQSGNSDTTMVTGKSRREIKVKPMMSSTPFEPTTITKIVSPPHYTQNSDDTHTADQGPSSDTMKSVVAPTDENVPFVLDMNHSTAEPTISSPGFDFGLSEENNPMEEPAGDFLSNLFGGMEAEQTQERETEFDLFF